MSATKTQAQSWRDWLPIHEANKIFPTMAPEKLAAIGRAMLAKQARGEKPIPEPIVLFYEGERPSAAIITKPGWWRQKTHLAKLSVGDGCSRLDAGEKYLGINWFEECAPYIRIEYLKGEGAIDPWAFSFDANYRRRQLKPSQRRDVIAEYRKRRPDLSDNAIAKELDVSPHTVGSVTKELEAKGDVCKLQTRADSKGRKQQTRKPRKLSLDAERRAIDRAIEIAESHLKISESANSETPEPAPAAASAAEPPVQLQVEPAVSATTSLYSLEDRRRNFIGALVGLTAEDLEWARKEFNDWLEDNTPKSTAA